MRSAEKIKNDIHVRLRGSFTAKGGVNDSSTGLDSCPIAQIIRCLKYRPCRIHQMVAQHAGFHFVEHHDPFPLDWNLKARAFRSMISAKPASVPWTRPPHQWAPIEGRKAVFWLSSARSRARAEAAGLRNRFSKKLPARPCM